MPFTEKAFFLSRVFGRFYLSKSIPENQDIETKPSATKASQRSAKVHAEFVANQTVPVGSVAPVAQLV